MDLSTSHYVQLIVALSLGVALFAIAYAASTAADASLGRARI